jgi:hypothetical protein
MRGGLSFIKHKVRLELNSQECFCSANQQGNIGLGKFD